MQWSRRCSGGEVKLKNDRIVELYPQQGENLYRTLIWCHLINEPDLLRGDPHCSCCGGDLFENDPSHEVIGVVPAPWIGRK